MESQTIKDLLIQAADAARQATVFDAEGQHTPAIYLYCQASYFLEQAQQLGYSDADCTNKATQYKKRAESLTQIGTQNTEEIKKEAGRNELGRADFLLREALQLDEDGEKEEAIEVYLNAVQLCMEIRKQEDISRTIADKLRTLAEQSLNRAEILKGIDSKSSSSMQAVGHIVSSPVSNAPQQAGGLAKKKGLQLAGRASYSKEELDVILRTSYINRREYVPFMSVDLKEKFAYSLPFTDKDGLLPLSPKQRKHFSRWCRPEDLSPSPKMIEVIDCFSIKQTCVSDCSFVASVAISALYEKKFKRRLITDIIFPKNRQGDPVYNPCGKYMIKLHINGIPRKVIIDDQLPVGKYNELLCSFSTNKHEFWISLIEKAYMKVMGGYDFPGSNSNIDLYALTGWIPERVSLHEKDFNKDNLYRKLLEKFHKGDVLVTVATGEMPDAEADRAGLVTTHAYAMLDIREAKGKRMFLLKNPWSHLRWKGNFSELDTKNWTPEMCKILNYDPKSAQSFDNGVFWIDYDSLCHFFDVLYMNWNPALFTHTFCVHQSWNAGIGPARDLYNIGENPQYSLEVKPTNGAGVVWVLLTRHITDIEDFRNNKEYITLLVYKSGKKIFYPFDPSPYIDGVRINSPHYLCQMVLKGTETQRFTLVVSQYEKQHTINYTLRVYASCPFQMQKIPSLCKYKHEEKGQWSGSTAGGCTNYPATYGNNPMYQFRVSNDLQTVRIELKAPKEIQIGFEVMCVEAKNTADPKYFHRKSTGNYRSGFCVLEMEDIPIGVYNVVPSTFYPGKEGPYYLTFLSSVPIKASRIK